MKNGLCIMLALFFYSLLQAQPQQINISQPTKAVFIKMNSIKVKDYIAYDTLIKVNKGEILCITETKAFMVVNEFVPYENEVSVWIDDQPIHFYKSPFNNPLWLPEGNYHLRMVSSLKNKDTKFTGFISGLAYNL